MTKENMETKKRLNLGKYSITIGIAAGFVALGMLSCVWEGNPDATEILLTVGIATTSMSVFLLSTEEQKKKSCKKSNPRV
jgi:hypothetical protein